MPRWVPVFYVFFITDKISFFIRCIPDSRGKNGKKRGNKRKTKKIPIPETTVDLGQTYGDARGKMRLNTGILA